MFSVLNQWISSWFVQIFCFVIFEVIYIGGSRISQTRGRQPPRWGHWPIIWPNISRKLHDNETNWTSLAPPGSASDSTRQPH